MATDLKGYGRNMSGGNLAQAKCGSCNAINSTGLRPLHYNGCAFNGLYWDITCQCGHWGGCHGGVPDGCLFSGCKCNAPYTGLGPPLPSLAQSANQSTTPIVFPEVKFMGKPVSKKCECGANKCGHADMTPMHSTWCPVFAKDKPKEEDVVAKVRSQKKVNKWNPFAP